MNDKYIMRARYVLIADGEALVEVPPGEQPWEYAYNNMHRGVVVPEGFELRQVDVETVAGLLVKSVCWYDLHGPGDVMLAEAAPGHFLPEEACDRIGERLASLGLSVVDRWNVGYIRVSFRISGRIGADQFTDEERKVLRGDDQVSDATLIRLSK